MTDLVAFIEARLAEDAWWAQEASRDGERYNPDGDHWRWECETTDQPVVIDPMLGEYVEGVDHAPVGLRSVETRRVDWGADLSNLVVRGQQEITAVHAGHIARHDPARVLREVAAKRSAVDMHRGCGRGTGYCDDGGHGWDDVGCGDLANLASVWSDHPDYDESWLP